MNNITYKTNTILKNKLKENGIIKIIDNYIEAIYEGDVQDILDKYYNEIQILFNITDKELNKKKKINFLYEFL